MEISVTKQTLDFLLSMSFGFFLGFLYDLFRILRKNGPANKIICFMEDSLFWILATGLMFLFIALTNSGEMRYFIFLGAFIGGGFYFLTLSTLFMFVTNGILDILKKLLKAVFKVVLWPFKLIFTPILRFLKKLIKKLRNYFKFQTKKVIMTISNKRKEKKRQRTLNLRHSKDMKRRMALKNKMK